MKTYYKILLRSKSLIFAFSISIVIIAIGIAVVINTKDIIIKTDTILVETKN
jgi:hypothetical protein